MQPTDTSVAFTMPLEEARSLIGTGLDAYAFVRDTSWLGKTLATLLRGGRKADPNVGPALRAAEELDRRLEALCVHTARTPAPTPTEPRFPPPADDLPAMLSDAARDARYVARLTMGGAGMAQGNAPEALRVVRLLRPKLEAIWAVHEAASKADALAAQDA